MNSRLTIGLFVTFATFGLKGPAQAAAPTYQVLQKIAVPGDGGWDYVAVDADARRLFISHATQVQVLDIDTGKIVGAIADTPGVHGIALAPERGFISNGKEGTVTMFDRKTLRVLGKSKAGKNPDAIVYDPASKRVLAMNGRSHDATVLNAADGKVLGAIALGGKPEFSVADGDGTVFVNLEDQGQLLALDPVKLSIKARWPLAGCEEPSSLAIDTAHRRLFTGCGNRVMAVVDADQGRVITTVPIGEHVDATVFDPEQSRIFNSNGDGTLTVVVEESPDHYRVLENAPTQKGARTVALDPRTHRLFLPVADFGPAPVKMADGRSRPSIAPGSFAILVVGERPAR